MIHMNFSYERVSTSAQSTDRQEVGLQGIAIDRRFIDKLSGSNKDRPQLQALQSDVNPGDQVFVESISRLGRNVDDVRALTQFFVDKGVAVHFVKEGISTNGATYKFLMTVLASVAELEREQIVANVKDGIAAARARGVRLGRPPTVLPKNFGKLHDRYKAGQLTKVEMARILGICRSTVYKYFAMYDQMVNEAKEASDGLD
jgi:DNA invertase Pin-like site-specific DNA recombinase